MAQSTLGRAYRALYEKLCGRHPSLRPWHSQWLAAHLLNRDLEAHLPGLPGRVLDVGCGQQPYRRLLKSASEYAGADVTAGPTVDIVIVPNRPWPIEDGHFDAVLMTQVVEYLNDVEAAVSEMRRVLKPGGIAVVSFPFIFNEHGANDYLRLSARSVPAFFAGFSPLAVSRQGALGSTMGTLFLNWLDQSLNLNRPLRLLRPLLLPLWLPLCLVVNLLSLVVNLLDRTNCYYGNVFLVMRKSDERDPAGSGTSP